MSDLKMFLYISHAKVDMLYQQLPRKDPTGAEYGVDVKLFRWIGKREPAKEAGPIEKLFAVVEHLKRAGKVGNYPDSLQYVEGTADMTWGTYLTPNVSYTGEWPRAQTEREISQDTHRNGFCLFGAETDGTVMGLVGSIKHLIGTGSGPLISFENTSTYRDALVALLSLKQDASGEAEEALMRPTVSFLRQNGRSETALTSALECPAEVTPEHLLVIICNLEGCRQRLEFFARIYDVGKTKKGTSVLIGSPLYVAVAD